ncbi:hypothetical protein ABKN59_004445 [Abortiporus biennis]
MCFFFLLLDCPGSLLPSASIVAPIVSLPSSPAIFTTAAPTVFFLLCPPHDPPDRHSQCSHSVPLPTSIQSMPSSNHSSSRAPQFKFNHACSLAFYPNLISFYSVS